MIHGYDGNSKTPLRAGFSSMFGSLTVLYCGYPSSTRLSDISRVPSIRSENQTQYYVDTARVSVSSHPRNRLLSLHNGTGFQYFPADRWVHTMDDGGSKYY